MGVSAGRLIQGEFIVMFYGPILLILLFEGGPIYRGAYLQGGAITDFYSISQIDRHFFDVFNGAY